jgi:hypothetical protein
VFQQQQTLSGPGETSTERQTLPHDVPTDPTTLAALGPVAPTPPENSQRPEIAVLNPIAVKKEDWRLSVEAAGIADKVRVGKGYPLHGTPFHGLSSLKQVIDPEVLQKMTEIRLRDKEERDAEVRRKVDEKKKILRDGKCKQYCRYKSRRLNSNHYPFQLVAELLVQTLLQCSPIESQR